MKYLLPAFLPFLLSAPVVGAGHVPAVTLGDLTHIHGVVIPSGSDAVLLATHHGLFSVDPAGTATMISEGADDFMGFTAGVDGQLYASGHPRSGGNIGVIGSAGPDGDWTHLSDGVRGPVDFHAMTVSPADANTVYGSFGGIQVSQDRGRTWKVSGPGPAELIDMAAAAWEPGHLYAGTMRGLFESVDFGQTWTRVTADGLPVTAVETAPDGTLYAFVAGLGLAQLAGGDLTVITEMPDSVLLHIGFDADDQARLVAVTSQSGLLSSVDGGKSWNPMVPNGAE